MPSFRRPGSTQTAPSISQVACVKTLIGISQVIPMVDPSSLPLPPIIVDPLALLDLDTCRMMSPSDGSSSMRNSLEYSEEGSISGDSAYQPSCYSQCTSNLPSGSERHSTCEEYCPESDSRKRSGSATSSRSNLEQLPYSEVPNVNPNLISPSSKSSDSMCGFSIALDQVHALQEEKARRMSTNLNNTTSHHKVVTQKDHLYHYRMTQHIPLCQSDTMHSVFEDDSDDDEVPYLKKVFTWNTKKSKLHKIKTQPTTLKKQKSRVFKYFR